MAGTIQFFGIDRVIEIYNNRDIKAWSISQGKDFMFRGIGEDLLRETLEALKNGFTNPIYTLKVYDGITEDNQIKSNVAHDGCFNFKVDLPIEMQGMQGMGSYGNTGYPLLKENQDLRKRLEALEQKQTAEAVDPPEETLGSVLIDLLKNPDSLVTLYNVGLSMMGKPPMPHPPRAIGGVPGQQAQEVPVMIIHEDTDPGTLDKIAAAINKLGEKDPKIVEHLEKLARLSETNTAMFNILINQLEGMK